MPYIKVEHFPVIYMMVSFSSILESICLMQIVVENCIPMLIAETVNFFPTFSFDDDHEYIAHVDMILTFFTLYRVYFHAMPIDAMLSFCSHEFVPIDAMILCQWNRMNLGMSTTCTQHFLAYLNLFYLLFSYC